jgi:hypothetical protein
VLTLLLLSPACVPAGDPDVNDDGVVNVLDVSIVSSCQGLAPGALPACAGADVDRDGAIGPLDLERVIASWESMVCNGRVALCDRRFDQVAHPTTHNAFAAWYDGFFLMNQWHGLAAQLEDGIRGLMLDAWYYEEATGEHGNPASPTWLCHADCGAANGAGAYPGRIPLADGLAVIRAFLEAHPAEVVTLIFESYVAAADVEAAFFASGLDGYLYTHDSSRGWPTLREMITRGERVVVLTDDGSPDRPPWYHYQWSDLVFETHFSFPTLAALGCDARVPEPERVFGCADNRGEPGNDLFVLNHFVTQLTGSPGLAETANSNPCFLERALACWAEHNHVPNFVTVDFWDRGDVFAVVDELNARVP